MISLFRKVLSRVSVFRKQQEGSISVEALLILPLLAWAYLATFVYFDAFRAKNTNLKAAYTISDAISREADVNDAYLNSMKRLLNFLTDSRHSTKMRVTVLSYRSSDDKYYLLWSKKRGPNISTLTNSDLETLRTKLPKITDFDTLIIVETFMAYEPAFNVGINALSIDNFVVTRPRFSPGLCFNGGSCANIGSQTS